MSKSAGLSTDQTKLSFSPYSASSGQLMRTAPHGLLRVDDHDPVVGTTFWIEKIL